MGRGPGLSFNFEPTAIGSVPFKTAKTACALIFDTFKEIPFWPQLPRRSFLENMYTQYSERLPGLVTDDKEKTIHIDTSRAASEIEEVYQKYLEGDVEYFRISEGYAEGFYAFLDAFPGASKTARFVKGHTTGPVSFGLTLTDEKKRSVIYDKELFEVLTKTLCMKVRWQIRKLKARSSGVIIFIDEPYLVSIGSSYVNIDVGAAFEKLGELISAIKEEGAIAGMHCCGNTDWPLLLKSGIDVLNFDAYNFTKEFSLYGPDISEFSKKPGGIAWGIVPSSDDIDREDAKSLARRLKQALRGLDEKGVKAGSIPSVITPSCGVGSLDEDRARRVLEMTLETSLRFKEEKHG